MAIVRTKATRSVTWWVGVTIFAIAGFAMIVGRGYGRAGIMPDLTALAIMIIAAVHTLYGLIFGVYANNDDWHSEEERRDFTHRRRIYVSIALAVGIFIWLLGFHITMPLFLFLFIGISTRRWVVAGLLGLSIWVFTYVVLNQLMHIVFPPSVLQTYLIANGIY